MENKKITIWNLIIASIIFILSLAFNKFIVFSVIALLSAIGIFIYYWVFNNPKIKIQIICKYVIPIVLFCFLLTSPLFFVLEGYKLWIIFGIIFSLGGIITIYFIHLKNK